MPGEPKTVTFANFTDGINPQAGPYLLSNQEARDARNVVPTVRGTLRNRDGTQTHAAGVGNWTSPPESLYSAKNPTQMIAAANGRLFGIDASGVVTEIGAGFSNNLWDFEQAPAVGGQGPLYGANGVEARAWSGVGGVVPWTAATGTLPVGRYFTYQGVRLWVAGMDSYIGLPDPRSAVAWSNLSDPRDWPAANVVVFNPGDGEAITGLGQADPYVMVFKPSRAWRIYDLDTGANAPVFEPGCVAPRSLVETPVGTFFLSKDSGVMLTNGSVVNPISDKVLPLIDAIPASSREKAAATFFDGHYYLALGELGETVNTLLLDYDTILKSWWAHSIPTSQLQVWEPTPGDVQLFSANSKAARVERLFVPDRRLDADSSVPVVYYRGPHHTMGVPFRTKRVREVFFDGRGRLKVYLAQNFAEAANFQGEVVLGGDAGNFGGTGLFGGTGFFGGAGEIGAASVLNPGVARAWSVEFRCDTDDLIEVDSYSFLYQERTK